MDGCHAVEISSFGGIDGKLPLSATGAKESSDKHGEIQYAIR